MKVKNVPDTSGKNCNCNCNGWLLHWEKFANKKAEYCVVNACPEKATVGAHIRITEDAAFPDIYILPMCQSHNKTDGELVVKGGFTIVSADPKKTCAKN